MNYGDSFTETIAHTAAGTIYTKWFNVEKFNELYIYCTITFAKTKSGNESLTVNKMYRPTPDSEAEIVAFTAPIDASAAEEAEYAVCLDEAAQGNENMLGTRVRFKSTTTGNSFTADQSISIKYTIYAKRN